MRAPIVAVVDMDVTYFEMMDYLLTEEGYQLLRCEGSLTAHDCIRLGHPDVVVLDTWLEHPHSGWCVMEELRRDPATCDIPVIVATGDTHLLRVEAATLRSMAFGVLEKPFDLNRLLALIRSALITTYDTGTRRRA